MRSALSARNAQPSTRGHCGSTPHRGSPGRQARRHRRGAGRASLRRIIVGQLCKARHQRRGPIGVCGPELWKIACPDHWRLPYRALARRAAVRALRLRSSQRSRISRGIRGRSRRRRLQPATWTPPRVGNSNCRRCARSIRPAGPRLQSALRPPVAARRATTFASLPGAGSSPPRKEKRDNALRRKAPSTPSQQTFRSREAVKGRSPPTAAR